MTQSPLPIVDEVAASLLAALKLASNKFAFAAGLTDPLNKNMFLQGARTFCDEAIAKAEAALVPPPTQAGGEPVPVAWRVRERYPMDPRLDAAVITHNRWEYHPHKPRWAGEDNTSEAHPLYAAPIASKEACVGGVRITDWQEIATARRDGTHVLVKFHGTTSPPTVAHWFGRPDDGGWYLSVQQNAGPEIHPTHWMPVPGDEGYYDNLHRRALAEIERRMENGSVDGQVERLVALVDAFEGFRYVGLQKKQSTAAGETP